MITKTYSCATIGLEAHIIEVEVDLQNSPLPHFTIVGLGDTAIQEAKERVTSAIKNSGAQFPPRKKIINLAPANLRKRGPHFDLAIAVGILAGSKQITLGNHNKYLFIGELALDGRIRTCTGILPATFYALKKGFKEIFIPKNNAREAGLIKNIIIRPLENLSELILHFKGEKEIQPFFSSIEPSTSEDHEDADIAEIKGQEQAKRALEIAAAGKHNLLMSGPPGSGKTMLARSLPSILPPLEFEHALEVSKIYSVAGLLSKSRPLITSPPFRSIHHTASPVALVGGGSVPKPGEISLAHHGVLFLDEIAEFPQAALEALRQPLQDKTITINRAMNRIEFPADFILIAAKNPCPCGYFNDPKKTCQCSPFELNRYHKKLSGPFLDRIDLHIEVPRIKYEKLAENTALPASKDLKQKIISARKIQQERQKNTNNNLNSSQIRAFVKLNPDMEKLIRHAVDKFNLSARAYFKILKITRTIADLENSAEVKEEHLTEALQYRPNTTN